MACSTHPAIDEWKQQVFLNALNCLFGGLRVGTHFARIPFEEPSEAMCTPTIIVFDASEICTELPTGVGDL